MKSLRPLLVLALTSTLAPALMAVSVGTPQAKPAATPQAETKPKVEGMDIKGLKSRLFILQHKDPAALRDVLRRLLSGHEAAAMDANRLDGLKTLTVRDYPENLALIEDAIRRLDVPTPAGLVREDAMIEVTVHFLHASKEVGPDQVPEQLREVVRTLKGALAYKSYVLGTSLVQNVRGNSTHMTVKGSSEHGTTRYTYEWFAATPKVRCEGEKVMVDLSRASAGVDRREEVATPAKDGKSAGTGVTTQTSTAGSDLSLRDGETVVMGTSVLKDKGLVVVVTAKVQK